MVKAIAIILSVVLVIGVLGSIGYIGYHTIDVMTRGATFSEAIQHGWQEYVNMLNNIFGKEVPSKSTGNIIRDNVTYFENLITETVITETVYW